MRVRARTLLVTAIILVAGTIPAHAVGTPTPVKTSKAFEWLPAGGTDGVSTFFAWTQNIVGRPSAPDSAFFQLGSDAPRRINPGGTYGFVGGFDPGTSTLAYQQAAGNNSDIRLFDVNTRTLSFPPAGINNAAWQWSPAIDTQAGKLFVLYGENRFTSPTALWRVYVYDETTGTKTLLDSAPNRCACIFPGDIAYPWVVWSKGLSGTVWRYNIVTEMKDKILDTHRDEYFASVTADGTVYVAQAGDLCGTQARLYRVDPDGTKTLLFALPAGSEPLSIKAFDTGAGVTLYSDRYYCAAKTSNIFKIDGADTVTRPIGAVAATAGVRRTAATSRAWLRTRRSSLRCAASGLCRPALRAAASA